MTGSKDKAQEEADAVVADSMEQYDQIMEQQDVPVHERPLQVAILFARYSVLAVTHDGAREDLAEDADIGDHFDKPWFGKLVRMTESWYSKTFGPAALRPPTSTITGAIMHRGAIQKLRIPIVTNRKAEEGFKCWLAFPDHVEDDEDVLGWVQPKLKPGQMSPESVAAIETQAHDIANSLRFIASRTRNAKKGPDGLSGLLHGAVKHLDSFPSFACMSDEQVRQKSMWELQMANEAFLKAYCLQKNSNAGYRKIHTISLLLQDALGLDLQFDYTRFAKWPTEKVMFEYRYATGPHVHSRELFEFYCLTIDLCKAIASSLGLHLNTGKARFLIQPMPWILSELEGRED